MHVSHKMTKVSFLAIAYVMSTSHLKLSWSYILYVYLSPSFIYSLPEGTEKMSKNADSAKMYQI